MAEGRYWEINLPEMFSRAFWSTHAKFGTDVAYKGVLVAEVAMRHQYASDHVTFHITIMMMWHCHVVRNFEKWCSREEVYSHA
ncbi:Uncharacterized protein TCM_033739 [Theobroma cacao]|uniref:Uncharacterized protein n=1 Tax=Theobroma cacao TaxID=3641 RepID=A0A061FBR5_THECC|nr:Uncharacterized protein TCM_033739 [Theobroma cacao]